jgi:hypothetical protein
MTESEREFRRELLQHLHAMHGRLTVDQAGGGGLTLEILEKMHRMMHTDGYACPPHEHKNPGPYDLGKIKLTLGKGYIKMIRKVAGGDLG